MTGWMTWAMMRNGRKSSLAEEAAPRCTRCGSERIVKNGKNACGRQQFRCRACRVLQPRSRTTAPERQAEIPRAAALERLSLRAAARVFAVGRQTLAGWLKKSREFAAFKRDAAAGL
jgi:transposase-like protein